MGIDSLALLGFGLLLGGVLTAVYLWKRQKVLVASAAQKEKELSAALVTAEQDRRGWEERSRLQEERITQFESERKTKENQILDMQTRLAALQSDNRHLQEKLNSQMNEFAEMQAKLKNDFKVLAGEILETNTHKFTEQNKKNLDLVLGPLGEKIREFQKDISDKYTDEAKERSALKNELNNLMNLNLQMSKEANNLTKALKGDSKKQGNWGELILQKILENSGLIEGREFTVQKSFATEEGGRLLPDVIIHLPENRNIIIDSKVSLTAYERYCSSEFEEERQSALKDHILSLRAHIRELSEKKYQQIYDINSPDYVLMFLPVEPAFVLAAQEEQNLYTDALQKGIALVYPTSLMATLKTVEHTWKQDKQKRYALEIASESGKLYDKFVLFLKDMEAIDRSIDTSKSAFDKAFNKLRSGTGNLISRAEKIRELGAKASKAIPENLVSLAQEGENEAAEWPLSEPKLPLD